MGNIIYFAEHLNSFQKIEPVIREVCFSAGASETMTDEVIDEYRSYFEQLSLKSEQESQEVVLNHACHIILGLLIKEKLQT
ncbi:MAG: hypothetical protein GY951_06435 [Psychromonas sp.]|nr:hypothetical protein [Alteromonadales bacterium]MCP5077680.1 hypothetical protein [Psychromonas sp.]